MPNTFAANIRQERDFMESLGGAITGWQSVEQAVYTIYAHFMHGANVRLVSTSFFHIQSFESRALLTDRCAFFALSDDDLKTRWRDLYKRLTKQARIRNQIVHFAYIIGIMSRRKY